MSAVRAAEMASRAAAGLDSAAPERSRPSPAGMRVTGGGAGLVAWTALSRYVGLISCSWDPGHLCLCPNCVFPHYFSFSLCPSVFSTL